MWKERIEPAKKGLFKQLDWRTSSFYENNRSFSHQLCLGLRGKCLFVPKVFFCPYTNKAVVKVSMEAVIWFTEGPQKVFGLCVRSKTLRNVIAVCAACFNEVLGGWTSASGLLITYIYLHVALRWSRMFQLYVRNHTTSRYPSQVPHFLILTFTSAGPLFVAF